MITNTQNKFPKILNICNYSNALDKQKNFNDFMTVGKGITLKIIKFKLLSIKVLFH